MITIVDYGLGNINAFVNVYDRLNIPTRIANTSEKLVNAKKIILPGVGHFDYAMSRLNSSGMRPTLESLVRNDNVPIMGICVGMQMLALDSDEGVEKGLGWIDAHVKKFDISLIPYKTRLPHMGWNTMTKVKDTPLLNGFNIEERFYFLHSYYFECNNPEDIICETEYGIKYASAVNRGNIYGIQFHPEKSHSNGINLLKNFALL